MFDRRKFAILTLAALVASLPGCLGRQKVSDDPKVRLQEYISRSFVISKAEDRKELLGYLGGDARTRLAAWSDEQFRSAFIDSKRQFIKLAFKEIKPVSPKEVNITYELTYLDQNRGQDAKVTHRKLCQLMKDKDRWLIHEVRNINELIEYRNEMSLP